MQPDAVTAAVDAVLRCFFQPIQNMQATLAVLCDCHPHQAADPVTHTLLTMLSSPIHVQLTAVGWQPFKGKELTFPFQRMTNAQRESLKHVLLLPHTQWSSYEHAMVLRSQQRPPLASVDVLEALCNTILHTSKAYSDRRLRVAVCNILLQRVQANMPIEKGTLRVLNARLFPTHATPE